METAQPLTPYQNMVRNSFTLFIDLAAQLVNLAVSLSKEIGKIEPEQTNASTSGEDNESGSPISVRAIKTSIILLEVNALETVSNFLAELALKTNEAIVGAPDVQQTLTQIEVDFLAEQRTYIDVQTGALKIRESVFVPTLDKLSIIPLLLGKLHNQSFRLDKSGKGWQKIQKLKEIRDGLSHFRTDFSVPATDDAFSLDLDNVKPAIVIKNIDLFEGIEATRWYIAQLISLLRQIDMEDYRGLTRQFLMLDVVYWMVLLNLYKICGIAENTFYRDYPSPVSQKPEKSAS